MELQSPKSPKVRAAKNNLENIRAVSRSVFWRALELSASAPDWIAVSYAAREPDESEFVDFEFRMDCFFVLDNLAAAQRREVCCFSAAALERMAVFAERCLKESFSFLLLRFDFQNRNLNPTLRHVRT